LNYAGRDALSVTQLTLVENSEDQPQVEFVTTARSMIILSVLAELRFTHR
jgi:hypothetical protein